MDDTTNAEQYEKLKNYIVILISLVETIANAGEIDLDETTLNISSDGNQLASKSISYILEVVRNEIGYANTADAERVNERK